MCLESDPNSVFKNVTKTNKTKDFDLRQANSMLYPTSRLPTNSEA